MTDTLPAWAIRAAKTVVHKYHDPERTASLLDLVSEALLSVQRETREQDASRKFQFGDRVTKIKGSSWTGRVVGFYCTSLTPFGYAVESETETGSVQIYPEAALRPLSDEVQDA